ncbi:MAG: hypothetical protein ABFD75_00275 [Smithella sp.]
MKKFLLLCLLPSLLIACSSEKDAKPNPAAAPAMQTAAAPAAQEPITSLSGEYVLTQTESKKTKVGDQEYTFQTTHTFTLQFTGSSMVRYIAKSNQTIDPPAEGMMLQTKLYNTDTTGTYEIRVGKVVAVTFSSSEKLPWVEKGVLLLRLKDANTLEIVYNGSEFRKQ